MLESCLHHRLLSEAAELSKTSMVTSVGLDIKMLTSVHRLRVVRVGCKEGWSPTKKPAC